VKLIGYIKMQYSSYLRFKYCHFLGNVSSYRTLVHDIENFLNTFLNIVIIKREKLFLTVQCVSSNAIGFQNNIFVAARNEHEDR
jgi:hypothetical protein